MSNNVTPPQQPSNILADADPATKKLGAGIGILAGIGAYAFGAGLLLSGVVGLAGLATVLYFGKPKLTA